jgi:adenylosuccinate lyase
VLSCISPIDGRYAAQVKELSEYFSEYALIRYRVFVEIQYFIALWQYRPSMGEIQESTL